MIISLNECESDIAFYDLKLDEIYYREFHLDYTRPRTFRKLYPHVNIDFIKKN